MTAMGKKLLKKASNHGNVETFAQALFQHSSHVTFSYKVLYMKACFNSEALQY